MATASPIAAIAPASVENRRSLPEAVMRALREAPMGPPETEEERRLVAAARTGGESIDGEVIHAEVMERSRRAERGATKP